MSRETYSMLRYLTTYDFYCSETWVEADITVNQFICLAQTLFDTILIEYIPTLKIFTLRIKIFFLEINLDYLDIFTSGNSIF